MPCQYSFRLAFMNMYEGIIVERRTDDLWVPYRIMNEQLERYDTANNKWVVSAADMGYLIAGTWRTRES